MPRDPDHRTRQPERLHDASKDRRQDNTHRGALGRSVLYRGAGRRPAAARAERWRHICGPRQSRGYRSNASGRSDGLFYQDTRYLSHLELRINEKRPLLLGSNIRDDNSALFVDLTNPDFFVGQHVVLEKDTVHILRTIFLWRDTAYQRFGVRNYGDQPIDLRLSILFENDFADLFEVRGSHRERRGTATTKLRGDDQVLLNYLGLDAKVRHTTLTFDPPPDRLATGVAVYDLHLAPGEMRPLFLTVSCDQTQFAPSRRSCAVSSRLAARCAKQHAAGHPSKLRMSGSTRCYASLPPTLRC